MKVCYSPYNARAMEQNNYILQLTNSMKAADIEILGVRDTFKNIKNFREVKVINLNWFENVYDQNKIKAYLHYLKKIGFLYFLKFLNKKIIWTVHNKIPHDANNTKLSKKIMLKLAKLSAIIITHCDDTNEEIEKLTNSSEYSKKINKVKHPNYIGLYNKPLIKNSDMKNNIKSSDLVFLFLGQIKPYKNIELIIQIANKFKNCGMKFIIAGKCINQKYQEKIEDLIKDNDDIIPFFRFIKNEEIADFFNNCDVVLLPYDINSSLNSGAAILAFSLGKTVICPKIGTLNELNSFENLYSYTYQNEQEHYQNIVKHITNILNYKDPKNTLNRQGENLKDLMEREYSISKISKEISKVYSPFMK